MKRAPLQMEGALEEVILRAPEAIMSFVVPPIVPYRTGQLAETFFSRVSGLQAVVGPTVYYAPMVEFGTGPHDIYPIEKKALYWPGAKHPVKKVHHPGSKPNPFMERIVEAASPLINTMFVEAVRSVLNQIANP